LSFAGGGFETEKQRKQRWGIVKKEEKSKDDEETEVNSMEYRQ
jgi:hypothetical protein